MAQPERGAGRPRRHTGLPLVAVLAVSSIVLVVPDASLSFGSPRRTVDLAVTYDLPDSTTDAGCPGPHVARATAEKRRQNMAAAQLELIRLGRTYPERAAGIFSCAGAFTLTVRRVPGSGDFDAAVRDIARRHHVRVSLEDSKWSRLQLGVVRQTVLDRSARLAARGAKLLSVRVDPDGYVEVGVAGSVRAGRKVLADVADRTRVVPGFMGEAQARRP